MDPEFKTCRFCQESIRTNALKCRFCGEFVENRTNQATLPCIEIEGRVTRQINAPAPKAARSESTFLKFWRGEFSLQLALRTAAAAGTVIGLSLASLAAFLDLQDPAVEFPWGVTMLALSMGTIIPLSVGTWRSAEHHVERGGEQRLATSARILVAIGALMTVILGALAAFPGRSEFSFRHSRTHGASTFRLTLSEDGRCLLFNGTLGPGAAESLERALQRNPELKTLRLNSTGGSLGEAAAMAELVTACDLTTTVREVCLGAAALVFIAGTERILEPGARVGFTCPNFDELASSRRDELEEKVVGIFREAGVKKDFAIQALSNESTWFPSITELREAGVITRDPGNDLAPAATPAHGALQSADR